MVGQRQLGNLTHHHKTWDCEPCGRAVYLGSLTFLLSTGAPLPNKISCFIKKARWNFRLSRLLSFSYIAHPTPRHILLALSSQRIQILVSSSHHHCQQHCLSHRHLKPRWPAPPSLPWTDCCQPNSLCSSQGQIPVPALLKLSAGSSFPWVKATVLPMTCKAPQSQRLLPSFPDSSCNGFLTLRLSHQACSTWVLVRVGYSYFTKCPFEPASK